MSLPSEVEVLLVAWREKAKRAGITSESTLDELESHLRESAVCSLAHGLDARRAVSEAIVRLGPVGVLKEDFSRVGTDRRLSHVTGIFIGCGIGAFLLLWCFIPWQASEARWVRSLGNLGVPVAILSIPLQIGWTVYHAVAWRANLAAVGEVESRGSRKVRWLIWSVGLVVVAWWAVAPDWLFSLLFTYVMLVVLLALGSAAMALSHTGSARFSRDACAMGVVIAVMVSAAWTLWPTRLMFALSRSKLEAAATRLEAGESVKTPFWAGGLRIARAEIRDHDWGGGTCLWVIPNVGSPTGFIRKPVGQRRDPGNNVNRRVRLNDRWFYVSED